MVELDGTVEVVGPGGRFRSRTCSRVVTSSWSTTPCGTTARHTRGSKQGCTFNLWHLKEAVYLNARGVSFAVLTSGRWDEVAPYVEFMATAPGTRCAMWRRPSLQKRGHIICYLRDGDRVFRTYSTTGRGNEPADTSLGLLDMTPYGRGEVGGQARRLGPRGATRAGTGAPTPTGMPTARTPAGPCRRTPPRRDTRGDPLGRHGHHH